MAKNRCTIHGEDTVRVPIVLSLYCISACMTAGCNSSSVTVAACDWTNAKITHTHARARISINLTVSVCSTLLGVILFMTAMLILFKL